MTKKLPLACPSCEKQLKVRQLYCEHCETEVTGIYTLPILAQLTTEDQKFIISFVKASGSLKDMAQGMKLSYPTVRNILDDIIVRIKNLDNDGQETSL